MVDKRLEFDNLAVFGLLEMIHGSYHEFGAQKKQEIGKIGLQNHLGFCIVVDQRSLISAHSLIIRDELCCENWPNSYLWPFVRINGSDFIKGPHKTPEIMI